VSCGPSAASLGGRCFREHPLHEGALGLGVGDVVVAEPVGQGPLEVAVGVGHSGVGPEGIAEGEMTVERRSPDGADVQVMSCGAGRGGEGFAAGNPKVAFVQVAEGPESLDDGRQVDAVGDDHVQVDVGLAARPGTAVLPTCSMATARGPRVAASRSRSCSKVAGQLGS
jgi:hypothetical protein